MGKITNTNEMQRKCVDLHNSGPGYKNVHIHVNYIKVIFFGKNFITTRAAVNLPGRGCECTVFYAQTQ